MSLCTTTPKRAGVYSYSARTPRHDGCEPVWVYRRGDELATQKRFKPAESLQHMLHRVRVRELEDRHRRMCSKCELNNVNPKPCASVAPPQCERKDVEHTRGAREAPRVSSRGW